MPPSSTTVYRNHIPFSNCVTSIWFFFYLVALRVSRVSSIMDRSKKLIFKNLSEAGSESYSFTTDRALFRQYTLNWNKRRRPYARSQTVLLSVTFYYEYARGKSKRGPRAVHINRTRSFECQRTGNDNTRRHWSILRLAPSILLPAHY